MLVACHLPKLIVPGSLRLGTYNGNLLEDQSALGRFLIDDVRHQYMIELFLDQRINSSARQGISARFEDMFLQGNLGHVRLHQ